MDEILEEMKRIDALIESRNGMELWIPTFLLPYDWYSMIFDCFPVLIKVKIRLVLILLWLKSA